MTTSKPTDPWHFRSDNAVEIERWLKRAPDGVLTANGLHVMRSGFSDEDRYEIATYRGLLNVSGTAETTGMRLALAGQELTRRTEDQRKSRAQRNLGKKIETEEKMG